MNWGDSNGKKWEDYDTIKCPNGQIIDMQKLLDEQQRAKAALVHLFPFFNAFINKLKPICFLSTENEKTQELYRNNQYLIDLLCDEIPSLQEFYKE